MPREPRISSSVSGAVACAQRGIPGSASVSPIPAPPDRRSIEGHTHDPIVVAPRIERISVAVARGSVCPDSIRRAYRPTKGVSGSHTWCLMRGGVELGRARLPLPFIGQINLRLCSFYLADCEKPGPSSVSSTSDATLVYDSIGFCLPWFYKYDAAGRLNSMLYSIFRNHMAIDIN